MTKIKEAIEVANKFNDTIFTNTPEMVEALQTLLELGQRYEAVKACMPEKKKYYGDERDTELTSEYDQGYSKGHDNAIDACISAITRICGGCKKLIGGNYGS